MRLEASCGRLASVSGQSCAFLGCLGPSCTRLECVLGRLVGVMGRHGTSRERLGPSSGCLGLSWGRLGGVLGSSWGVLVPHRWGRLDLHIFTN